MRAGSLMSRLIKTKSDWLINYKNDVARLKRDLWHNYGKGLL